MTKTAKHFIPLSAVRRGTMALAAMGALTFSSVAQADVVTLTFDRQGETGAQPACTGVDGGATNRLCVQNGDQIGVDYGSTATLGVSYDAAGPATSLRSTNGIFNASTFGASNTNLGAGTLLSHIFFTPAAGYEVSFRNFDYFNLSASFVTPTFRLFNASGNLLGSHATVGSTSVRNHAFDSGYFSGPLTFAFGGAESFNPVGVDNIQVDVRRIAGIGAVPEPATWAMMIFGFGVVGGAMRRRKVGARIARLALA